MVSEEALEEFKKIWKAEYGTDISDADALPKAIALLTMFNAIYRPVKKEWVEEFNFNEAMPTIEHIRWLVDEPNMPDKEAWKVRDEFIRILKIYNKNRERDANLAGQKFNMLKGTIIENSLAKKSVLKKVMIAKTRLSDDWILHDVWIKDDQIPKLSQALADGPWYIHFWRPGEDTVTVVFKNKTFTIKFSDKATWADALAYGKSIGIPKEQLDFPID